MDNKIINQVEMNNELFHLVFERARAHLGGKYEEDFKIYMESCLKEVITLRFRWEYKGTVFRGYLELKEDEDGRLWLAILEHPAGYGVARVVS